MALETTNYQCPNCSGRLDFDGASGKLVCASCRSSFSPREIEQLYAEKQRKADEAAAQQRAAEAAAPADAGSAAGAPGADAGGDSGAAGDAAPGGEPAGAAAGAAVSEHASAAGATASHGTSARTATDDDPIQTYLKSARWEDAGAEGMRSYTCPSCGAELVVDSVTAVTSCPYCGNNTVVPGQLSGLLKPDCVIPFEQTKEQAIAALKDYYEGKRFLPKSFTANNHLEDVQGVYVPFWLYSADVEASGSFEGLRERTWTDARNTYVETQHYNVSRQCTMAFDRVPVDGSTRMPDAHMDAIEPYDYGKLAPFSIGYLPGYLTDRYDQDADDCRARAESRVSESALDAMRGTVTGYDQVIDGTCNTDVTWDSVSYALLPVWMLHTTWEGEDFLFAMNGQTGKVIGNLPVDKRKVVVRFIALFVPAAIVLYFVFLFLIE